MAIDPRHLRAAEAVRLLNSTPLGEVVQPHVIYKHLNRAGFKVGDGKRMDLLKYAAWLFHARRENFEAGWTEKDYESHKDAVNSRNRAMSESSRDIGAEGWVHEPKDPQRKESARRSFRTFCDLYFPQTFHLPWSPDHLTVIAKIEQAVLQGGLFAMAMPRGSGKTSLCEAACLWALLYGHRDFIALIGSDEDHAAGMLDSIKSELENNDLLEEDFSEVSGPVRALEGIHQRAAGQLYRGARTQVSWTAKEIVLPTIPDSPASGGIIQVAGITGRIRGMKHKRSDGKAVRPSLVLLDDPQTDESARSPSQCEHRESILAGAILGLAGPGRKIAGLMTLTVVHPDDMADRLLDRTKHPNWQGQRTKMLISFPTNQKLWDEYAQIRARCLQQEKGLEEAHQFYRNHREEMDQGARAAWEARHHPDEESAIQHAMNLKLNDEAAFFAEYQNEPLVEQQQQDDLLSADQITAKVSAIERGEVPQACNHLSAFIDVQQTVLFWAVCAWQDDFTGYVIDYGAYPDQKLAYFTLRDVKRTLALEAPGRGFEGTVRYGLDTLTTKLLGREWRRDDGAAMRIGKLLIDANWGNSTDVVYQFCRESPHAAIVIPSHGRYVGASSIPFDQYTVSPGDRVGHHWRIPSLRGKRSVRHVVYDTNHWKSFMHARLGVAKGDRGCLSVFSGTDHRLFADHLTAEFRVRTQGRGRTVDEWKLRAPGRDNHWLDCVVGCAVGASMLGAALQEAQARRLPRKTITFAEAQKRRKHWSASQRRWIPHSEAFPGV